MDQATAQLNYRELYLDQRRALYEMEAEANLGDAMVRISEAQRYMAETQFKTAMAWARLDALLGKTVYAQEPVVTGKEPESAPGSFAVRLKEALGLEKTP